MPSNAAPPRDSTRFVALCQKAHGSMSALQRVDDQLAALIEQRRKVVDELRSVQIQINDEFERAVEMDRLIPPEMLASDTASTRISLREARKLPDARMSDLETASPLGAS